MKKIILCFLILLTTQSLVAQKIILHRNAGGDQTYQLSSVDSISFQPFVCGDDIRYEGKTYGTVLIGTQCWMKKNLDVGVMIQVSQSSSNNGVIEKYCFNNDTSNCTIYGGLYEWTETMQYVVTVNARGICPDGWHIPTAADFQILKAAVNNNGNALKEIGQGSGSGAGTNTSGFSALLAGGRWASSFSEQLETYYWQTDKYNLCLYAFSPAIDLYNYGLMYGSGLGFSVRCLKDQ